MAKKLGRLAGLAALAGAAYMIGINLVRTRTQQALLQLLTK
jgi:hypothetical protein